MTRTVRAELLKLATIRLPLGLLTAAALLTATIATLRGSQAGGEGHMAIPPVATTDGLTALVASTDMALVLALVLGVVVAAGERQHGTATTTFLATPGRPRVVAAKALVAALAGAAVGLAGAVVSTAIALGFVAADGGDPAIGGDTMARYAAGATLGAALVAAAGVGIGALVREQLDAVMGALVWALIAERLLGGLFEAIAPYLPYTAATTLGGTPLTGTADPLAFALAAILVLLVAAALIAAGAWRTDRSDVT
ncbi:MAG TPA: hypothetical protein VKA65_06490 [Acidimicrobiales bacterium]|nr:hypothetical protein [Acidimicrobiales bacterium]